MRPASANSWVVGLVLLFTLLEGASAQSCTLHSDCAPGTNWFCNSVPFGRDLGTCDDCWKCCLFPNLFNQPATTLRGQLIAGACSQRCSCNIGSACRRSATCARGLFCKEAPWSPPVCAPCTACEADSDSTDPGGCSARCPAGALGSLLGSRLEPVSPALPAPSLVEAVVFLSFALEPWRNSSTDRTQVTKEELSGFLASEASLEKPTSSNASYTMSYVGEAVGSLYKGKAVGLPLEAVAAKLLYGSRSTLCSKVDLRLPATSMSRLTGPGCPCNYTIDAAFNRCPAGYRCSRQAYLGLTVDVLYDVAWAQLRGVCIPCEDGLYCESGVYVKPAMGSSLSTRDLDCPAGSYCPTPGYKIPCPSGFYCGQRTLSALPCNYTALLEYPDANHPMDGQPDLVTRLFRNREPIRGNYCPTGSSKPSRECEGGYYCPNSSVQVPCPAGYYCKPQSIEPVKCPPVVRCPKGTEYPDGRPLAGLIFGIIVVAMYLLFWLAQFVAWLGLRLVRNFTVEVQVSNEAWAKFLRKAGKDGVKEEEDMKKCAASKLKETRTGKSRTDDFFNIASMKDRPYWRLEDKISIRFRDVRGSLKAEGGAQLASISGLFEAGRLSAIMGPSGCGKTTLINVLSGRMPSAASVIDEKREVVALTQTIYRRMFGYVPQDDILHTDLTVRENLDYSARLKLPYNIPSVLRQAIVEDTLRVLAIHDKQDCIIGSVERRVISGGERKRVSIGVELVSKPSVLFMDEPTSGLDAARSWELCKLLSSLASFTDINIIAVIHQPRYSSFLLFDRLLLLATGGKVLFQGPPTLCVPYFRILGFTFPPEENHADTLLDIVSYPEEHSAAGVRVVELPRIWTTHGEPWLHRYSSPVERLRRAVRTMILSDRMYQIARVVCQRAQDGTGGGLREDGSTAQQDDESEAIAAALSGGMEAVLGGRGLSMETVLGGALSRRLTTLHGAPSQTKALQERVHSDDLETQSPSRVAWLEKKLPELFPKHEEEWSAWQLKRKNLMRYEQGLKVAQNNANVANNQNNNDGEPQGALASEADAARGMILLLTPPDTGEGRFVVPAGTHKKTSVLTTWKYVKDVVSWNVVQTLWLYQRNTVKTIRGFWPHTVLDVLLLLSAAFIVGVVQGSDWNLGRVPSNMTMAYLVLSVLATVTHLRTFSTFRNVQKREHMSGVSALSIFAASNATDVGWIFLSPAIYMAVYYFLVLPRADFGYYYVVGAMVCWWSAGLSYAISVSRIPEQAQLITAVITTLILGAFLQGLSPSIRSARGNALEVFLGLSFNRWAMEAASIQELKRYFSYESNEIMMIYFDVGICKMDELLVDDGDDTVNEQEALSFLSLLNGFDANSCDRYYSQANIILFCMGFGLRLIAFAQLMYEAHAKTFKVHVDRLCLAVDEVTGIRKGVQSINTSRKNVLQRIRRLISQGLSGSSVTTKSDDKSGTAAGSNAGHTGTAGRRDLSGKPGWHGPRRNMVMHNAALAFSAAPLSLRSSGGSTRPPAGTARGSMLPPKYVSGTVVPELFVQVDRISPPLANTSPPRPGNGAAPLPRTDTVPADGLNSPFACHGIGPDSEYPSAHGNA